jgi:hypothetical protein
MSRAELRFTAGRCEGLKLVHFVSGTEQSSQVLTVAQLAARGLLTITDRIILDQLAVRVDQLTRRLAAEVDL